MTKIPRFLICSGIRCQIFFIVYWFSIEGNNNTRSQIFLGNLKYLVMKLFPDNFLYLAEMHGTVSDRSIHCDIHLSLRGALQRPLPVARVIRGFARSDPVTDHRPHMMKQNSQLKKLELQKFEASINNVEPLTEHKIKSPIKKKENSSNNSPNTSDKTKSSNSETMTNEETLRKELEDAKKRLLSLR